MLISKIKTTNSFIFKQIIGTIVSLLFVQSSFSQTVDSTRVLFVGNSITYFNDMPQLFRSIALNKGKNVSVSMYAPGGTGFMHHYVDQNVYNLFQQSWDVVVLQPGTGESAGASWPVDTTIKRGRILLDSIYSYSPCAKVFLYQIPYGVPDANSWGNYFSVQQIIRDSVTKLADSLKVPFIPAGQCARAYYSLYPNLFLHNSYNDIHPNANGSFFTAASFYTGIFQESVSGCSYYGPIQQDSATKFFSIVDTVVLNHLTDWRINDYSVHAAFDYLINGNEVNFSDLSSNATTLSWNFGDGTFSSEQEPVHTYNSNGIFNVTQTVYLDGCVDSVTYQLTISDVGLNELEAGLWSLAPNPTSTNAVLNYNGDAAILSLEVLDINGKIIGSEIKPLSTTQFSISVPQTGMYFIRCSTNRSQTVKKLVVL